MLHRKERYSSESFKFSNSMQLKFSLPETLPDCEHRVTRNPFKFLHYHRNNLVLLYQLHEFLAKSRCSQRSSPPPPPPPSQERTSRSITCPWNSISQVIANSQKEGSSSSRQLTAPTLCLIPLSRPGKNAGHGEDFAHTSVPMLSIFTSYTGRKILLAAPVLLGVAAIFMIQWTKRTRDKNFVSFRFVFVPPPPLPSCETTIPNFLFCHCWIIIRVRTSLDSIFSTRFFFLFFSVRPLKEKGNWLKIKWNVRVEYELFRIIALEKHSETLICGFGLLDRIETPNCYNDELMKPSNTAIFFFIYFSLSLFFSIFSIFPAKFRTSFRFS